MKVINHSLLKNLFMLTLLTLSSLTSAQKIDSDRLQTLYFDAARQGDVTTLSAYYAAGLSPNVADKKGYTALILTAYHGQTDAVEFLLNQAGTNACQEDASGNTALMGAIFKGNFGPSQC